jgi:pimeloyl-ACP methyl ester carboxylesterase
MVAGARIHYAEAGQGEPLVLLHGWPQHWWSFRMIIAPLARSYRVICPDFRGLGWSEASPAGYSFLNLAADLIGLLDALDLTRVRLVGHDWGAAVGYVACLHWPERFARYIALGAVTPWSADAKGFASAAPWRIFLRSWHVFVLASLGRVAITQQALSKHALRAWRHVGRFTEEEQQIYLRPLRSAVGKRATRCFYRKLAFVELPYFFKHHRAIQLRTPTLHLNGERDPLTMGIPHGYRHQNAEQMQVELIADCGHFIAEERPDVLVARIVAFFA